MNGLNISKTPASSNISFLALLIPFTPFYSTVTEYKTSASFSFASAFFLFRKKSHTHKRTEGMKETNKNRMRKKELKYT